MFLVTPTPHHLAVLCTWARAAGWGEDKTRVESRVPEQVGQGQVKWKGVGTGVVAVRMEERPRGGRKGQSLD